MTRTYARADGRFQTVSSPVPVNFRNGQGEWTPIDDTLVRQPSGTYGVAADSYSLVLPVTAAEPVTAARGATTVAVRLVGASAASTVRVSGYQRRGSRCG